MTKKQLVVYGITMKLTRTIKIRRSRKTKRIHGTIDICAEIWNYCIDYIRTYYKDHNKLPAKYDLQKHLTCAKKLEKHKHWNTVGSQSIQDVTDRIYLSYQQFFRRLKKGRKTSPPKFKKIRKYKSYTLKQSGYKLLENNKIKIGNHIYRYHKSQEIDGVIHTVCVKRDPLGDIYIFITCTVEHVTPKKKVTSGNIVGLDFGLKTFLTASNRTKYESPLYYTAGLPQLRKASKAFSTKKKGSTTKNRAFLNLARKHKKVKNQRKDYLHKLARKHAHTFDVICIEDLNIEAMKKLWGKKISDLGFTEFVALLRHHCNKAGTTLVTIDRFYPSSKQCSECFELNHDLSLKDRSWTCGSCHITHDRDINAARNIARVGATTLGLGEVRPTMLALTA